MVIACIGDSCTFGQNVKAVEAWPHVLHDLTGHDVRNLGVNGDTTRLGLERWHRDVDLVKPDVVVIQFGHNDANLWDGWPRVSFAEYRTNLREMFLRTPDSIVLSPHTPVPPKDSEYMARVVEYQSVLMNGPLDIDILDDGYGVHPSPEGHRVYAEHVAGLLLDPAQWLLQKLGAVLAADEPL